MSEAGDPKTPGEAQAWSPPPTREASPKQMVMVAGAVLGVLVVCLLALGSWLSSRADDRRAEEGRDALDRAKAKQKRADIERDEAAARKFIEKKLAAGRSDNTKELVKAKTQLATAQTKTLLAKARSNLAKKAYDEVVKDTTAALKLDKDSGLAFLLRAQARQAKGDLKGAVLDATQVIKLDPKDPVAFRVRGECRQKLGQKAMAAQDLEKAKALGKK